VAIQPDGKIVVVGTATVSGMERFVVLRYTDAGALDGSFSGDGIATADFGAASRARGVALQPDGKIVVVGSTDASTAIAVARFTVGGVLDSSFSGDGKVTLDFVWGVDEGWDVAIQPDAKIVVVGSALLDVKVETVVWRMLANGAPDTSFAAGGVLPGVATVGFSHDSVGRAMALQSDGAIVVAGSTADRTAVTLVRLLDDGSSDDSFACDCTKEKDFGEGVDEGWDVAIRQDGRIVVAGSARVGGRDELVVLRYLADGTLDWSLGGGGYASAGFVESAFGRAMALGADGTIVVAGEAIDGAPKSALFRLQGWSDLVFGSGFESGDTCVWSRAVP